MPEDKPVINEVEIVVETTDQNIFHFIANNFSVQQSREVERKYKDIRSNEVELKPSRRIHTTIKVHSAEIIDSPRMTLTEEEIRNSKIDISDAIAADLGRKVKEEASKMKEEAPPPPTMPYSGIEGFIPALGSTVRECLDCGCLTPGGPTRCKRCAKETKIKYCKICKLPVDEGGLGDVCSRCLPVVQGIEEQHRKETAELLEKEADKMAAEEEIKQQSKVLQEKLDEPGAKEKLGRACHEYIMDQYKKRTLLFGDYLSIEKDLTDLINKQSRENRSNTPDFILAQFMARCLKALEDAITARDSFYGLRPEPGKHPGDPVSMKGPMTAEEEKEYVAKAQKRLKEVEEELKSTPGQMFGRPLVEGAMTYWQRLRKIEEMVRKQAIERITPFSGDKTFSFRCDQCKKTVTMTIGSDPTTHKSVCPGRPKDAPKDSIEVNPAAEKYCLRDSNGSIQIRFASFEESEEWMTENRDKPVMHYPKGGMYRIEVGVGGTDSCIIFDIGPEGSTATDLLKAAADTLRKFGMKATTKPLAHGQLYPLVLDQGVVEEALKAFEEKK